MAHPNLKVKARKVEEGAFLLPLRRISPLSCNNPGPSTDNIPLVVVTPTHLGPNKSLGLVKNHCSLLLKKAKNYSKGVGRSPTGVKKQRRYQDNKSNKRKHQESTASEDPSSTLSDQHSLQVVTSFSMRTLLLEDLWFLKEGTPVALFFHDESLPPRYAKKWMKIWNDTLQSMHLPQVLCQGRSFKQLTGWVYLNPDDRRSKVVGLHPYPEIEEALKEVHQHGLHLKFPYIPPSSNFNLTNPPTDCIPELLCWFEVFQFPQSIFVQADYHPERPWLTQFRGLKASGDDRLTLLHRLVQETPGDRYMLSDLRHVWEHCKSTIVINDLKQEHESAIASLREELSNAVPPPFIEPDVIKDFCEKVDKRILDRMEDCFGRFCNIFDKFLSESETRELANDFERMLPVHFNSLMGSSGYTKKLEEASVSSEGPSLMRQRFSLDVLFQFILKARKQNNHRLVPFAMVFTMGQYACGHPLLAMQIPVWLGLSVSKRTMERRIQPWLDTYENRTKKAIRRVTSLLCVFDNLQDGRRLQFQHGESSTFTRVTARFMMTMYLSKFPQWVYSFMERPSMTFIQQSIPAAFNMTAFEQSPDTAWYNVLKSMFFGTYISDTQQHGNPFDCSGKRVRYYQQIRSCCWELGTIKRYLSTRRRLDSNVDYTLQPTVFARNACRQTVCRSMNKLRKNRQGNIFAIAKQFPPKVVQTWRSTPPAAELLILPVSVLDETTKTGASGIVLDFMVLHGLLEWNHATTMYEPRDSIRSLTENGREAYIGCKATRCRT